MSEPVMSEPLFDPATPAGAAEFAGLTCLAAIADPQTDPYETARNAYRAAVLALPPVRFFRPGEYLTASAAEYVPLWARPEGNPTAGLSDEQARRYWADHAVEHDCLFALRPGHGKPADLAAAWAELLTSVQTRGKHTPADRRTVAELRTAWGRWRDGRPYTVPAITPGKPSKAPKRGKPGCCPTCGQAVAA